MVYLLCDFETMRVLEQHGDVEARFSPCSSFKLPIALMGYDSGILTDEKTPEWNYSPDYDANCLMMLDHWKKPYTPAAWMQHSCVWYSQEVTRRLGMEKFKNYVEAFGYGNADVSGDAGQDNGLLRSWLTSSLSISPREQLGFIRKMLTGQLPVSAEAVKKTARILYTTDIRGGRLFGKTGSGFTDIAAGKQRGWYVGWLEKGRGKILFAALLDHEGPGFAGLKAREFMTTLLQHRAGNIDADGG